MEEGASIRMFILCYIVIIIIRIGDYVGTDGCKRVCLLLPFLVQFDKLSAILFINLQ